jgi:hypothetical protein
VVWNVVLWFPGPHPKVSEADMLLCARCEDDWVDGEWDPPYDNFIITQCTPVERTRAELSINFKTNEIWPARRGA